MVHVQISKDPGNFPNRIFSTGSMLVVHYLPYNLELPLLSNVPHCCRPEEVLTNEGILGGKKVFICVLYVRALTGAVQKSGRYRTTDQHNIKAVRGGLG